MQTTPQPEILFTATEVAEILAVKEYDLLQYHPADFGVPGDWRLAKTGGVLYTVRGALALAKAAQQIVGKGVEGYSLEVLVKQRAARPASRLPRPRRGSMWYQKGQLA